ncbi:MAG TPA: tRNA lysidine(34) synthetase TilS [Fibrobacteria bacterium]|nr:tRNA lysidine(34) synthetase TilS [Fibrobacteria bacterium]HOX51437.1 tRNA lysidine(34) synthetase TilS [Fibrobacteria bacterium]
MEDPLRSPLPGLTESVHRSLEEIPPAWRGCPLALCLSGGADSSALALLLVRREFRERLPTGMEALHVRHHLRGAQSQGDADSVHELCGRLGLPLRILDAPVASGPGLEARCRQARYHALRQAAPRTILATAHHRDDQAETVLLRLLRGAHARGLAGIHPWRDDGVWRPLLGADRADLESICRSEGWRPRFDASNGDRRFFRNEIRLDLLPRWERESPGIAHALADLADATHRLAPHLERALDRLADRVGLAIDPRGFALCLEGLDDPCVDPELALLLERTWNRVGRRPWAGQQLSRLLADASRPGAGRRKGGQGETAIWGGRRLRVEAEAVPMGN